jgi:hypothetical protein
VNCLSFCLPDAIGEHSGLVSKGSGARGGPAHLKKVSAAPRLAGSRIVTVRTFLSGALSQLHSHTTVSVTRSELTESR